MVYSMQTYISILNAYAAIGRQGRVYALVSDMTSAGLGLNKFYCTRLIATHVYKISVTEGTDAKIVKLAEQSKGWALVVASRNTTENQMVGITELELYNIPTVEFI